MSSDSDLPHDELDDMSDVGEDEQNDSDASVSSVEPQVYDEDWITNIARTIIKSRVESKDLSWKKLLDLWKEKLEEVSFEDLTGGPHGAIRAIQKHAWLSGFHNRGKVAYECLRTFGGDLVALGDDGNVSVNPETFLHRAKKNKVLARCFKVNDAESSIKVFLEEIRGCSEEELKKRIKEEEEIKFIVFVLRGPGYQKEELQFILKNMKETNVRDQVIRQQLDEYMERSSDDIKLLLDKAVDMHLRNFRVFKETQKRRLDPQNNSSADFVIAPLNDWNSTERETPVSKWFREGAKDQLTISLRRKYIKKEKKWYDQTIKKVLKLMGASSIRPEECKHEIFKLLELTEDTHLEEGTSRDTWTMKLKQYAEKKEAQRKLYEVSQWEECLKTILDGGPAGGGKGGITDIETRQQQKVILVFGYQLSPDGKTAVAVKNEDFPVIARKVFVQSGGGGGGTRKNDLNLEGSYLTELGVRLDGYFSRIDPERCSEARDRIINSALSVSADDFIVFYEFIPDSAHVPDAQPLERILMEPAHVEIPRPTGTVFGGEINLPMGNSRTGSGEIDSQGELSTMAGGRSSPNGKRPQKKHGNSKWMENGGFRREGAQLGFTHILLEVSSNGTSSKNPRNEHVNQVYKDLADTSGSRYLVRLDRAGVVEMEGMRLPSIAVQPRSSVATCQQSLSFRRFVILLPPSIFGLDPTDENGLGNLTTRADGKGFVESAETLAQIVSIIVEMKHDVDTQEGGNIIFKRLKSNPLILNCMSVQSLGMIHPLFQREISHAWKDIILPKAKGLHDLDRDERAAYDTVLALVVGEHSKPYPAALVLDLMGPQIMHILKTKTSFNVETIDIEPSNFQSSMKKFESRAETSVLTFTFVNLVGRVTVSMMEKLISIAAQSSSIKLGLYFSPGLVALRNRLSLEVRNQLYIHDLVKEYGHVKPPILTLERFSVIGATVHVARLDKHEIRKCISEIQDTISQHYMEWRRSMCEWGTNLKILIKSHEPTSPQQNTRVLVSPDASQTILALDREFSPHHMKFAFIDARERSCFHDLRQFLVRDFYSHEDLNNNNNQHPESVQDEQPDDSTGTRNLSNKMLQELGSSQKFNALEVIVLLHAQLLSRDRLHVVIHRCAMTKTPLLLMTDVATRGMTYIRVINETGFNYQSIPILQLRPSPLLRLKNQTKLALTRTVLGLYVLVGPELSISSEEMESLEYRCERQVGDWPLLGSLSEFLAHQVDGPDCKERILDILSKETPPEPQGSPSNQFRFLGDLVATLVHGYVSKYLDHGDYDSIVEKLITFQDVASHPLLSFTSQETRLAVFMRAIHDMEGPWWVPISKHFGQHSQSEGLVGNLRCFSNPGPILCNRFEENVNQTITPSYVDPGRGDSMTSLAEIIERVALQGGDLNWNEVHDDWKRTPQVSAPVLLHLLRESPIRLAIALSLSKSRIASLQLDPETVSRLTQDLEKAKQLLERAKEHGSCNELCDRMAALSWTLLRQSTVAENANKEEMERFRNFVVDYIESNLMFQFPEGGDDSDDLFPLRRGLISTLVTLDEPLHALISQREMSATILSEKTEDQALIDDLLKNNTKQLGAAFVALCLNKEWKEKILNRNVATSIIVLVRPFLAWLSTPNESSAPTKMRDFGQRFTPSAWAEFLYGACSKYQEKENVKSFVKHFILDSGMGKSKQFVGDLWTAILASWDSQRTVSCVRLCELFAEFTELKPALKGERKVSNPILDILLSSIITTKLDLDSLREMDLMGIRLSCSEILMKLYCDHFANHNGGLVDNVDRDIQDHQKFFGDTHSKEAMFEWMISYLKTSHVGAKGTRVMCLLWFVWVAKPGRNLPLHLLPKKETWEVFSQIVSWDNALVQSCRGFEGGLSLLAAFCTMPHTLSSSAIRFMLQHCRENIEFDPKSRVITLAQKDVNNFPAYGLHVETCRPVPRECIDYVLQEILGSVSKLSCPKLWKPSMKFPRVQEGFSVETLAHNLRLLVHLHIAFQDQQDFSKGPCIGHTGATLLAWLQVSGLQPNDIVRVLSSLEQKSLNKILSDYLNQCLVEEYYVYCPLPARAVITFVEPNPVNLFGVGEDSIQLTAQNVYVLASMYSSDVAEKLSSKVYEAPEDPKVYEEVVTELMSLAGHSITSKNSNHSKLWNEVPAVAEFIITIFEAKRNDLLPFAFRGFIDGLKKGKVEKKPNFIPTIIDCMFITIGMNPVNEGVVIAQMVDAFTTAFSGNEIDLFSNDFQREIEFMSKNVFQGSLQKCGNKILEIIRDRISNVKVRISPEPPISSFIKDYILRLQECSGSPNHVFSTRSPIGTEQRWYSDCVVGELIPCRRKAMVTLTQTTTQKDSPNREGSNTKASVQTTQGKPLASDPQLFEPIGDASIALNENLQGRAQRGQIELSRNENTRLISARNLLRIRTFPSYGIVEVTPGLHPVLRKPDPESEQGESGFARHRRSMMMSSFDSTNESPNNEAVHVVKVFSNNGETWKVFDSLPVDSTICARGFYLRKTLDGSFGLLFGTAREHMTSCSNMYLWKVVDTHRLAALHLDERVVKMFEILVEVAVNSTGCRTIDQGVVDQPLSEILSHLRTWEIQSFFNAGANNQEDDISVDEKDENEEEEEEEDEEEEGYEDEDGILQAEQNGVNLAPRFELMAESDEEKDEEDEDVFQRYLSKERKIVLGFLNLIYEIKGQVGKSGWIEKQLLVFFRDQPNRRYTFLVKKLGELLNEVLTMTNPEPRSEMVFTLDFVKRNHQIATRTGHGAKFNDDDDDDDIDNKLIAPHAHITKKRFREVGFQLLKEMEQNPVINAKRPFTQEFSDSECDDDEEEDSNINLMSRRKPKRSRKVVMISSVPRANEDDRIIDANTSLIKMKSGRGPAHRNGSSTDPTGKSSFLAMVDSRTMSSLFPFDKQIGFGSVLTTTSDVWTLDCHKSDHYFVALDTRELKLSYSDAHGLPVAYIFHKRLLANALDTVNLGGPEPPQQQPTSNHFSSVELRDRLLKWLACVVRSPLPEQVKQFMMETLRHGSAVNVAPALSRKRKFSTDVGDCVGEGEDQLDEDDVNLKIIANCVAAALPESPVRKILTSVYEVSRRVRSYFVRANDKGKDTYGVHVVKRSIKEQLKTDNIAFVECDLGHDSLINARDEASMYLKIIGKFTEFTWLVWVSGLPTIRDQLLKWLAEYTKHHPWRFVYLEECDTAWNFGENRDRCVLERAPPNISSCLCCKEDLENPRVKANRPCHKFEVDTSIIPDIQLDSWNQNLDVLLHRHLLGDVGKDHASLEQQPSHSGGTSNEEQWFYDSDDAVVTASHAMTMEPNSRRSRRGRPEEQESASSSPWSRYLHADKDYRNKVDKLLLVKQPALVLLVSPPGGGKSFYSEDLAKRFDSKLQISCAKLDGSDDELVDTALTTILSRKVPKEAQHKFLIIDEFHMLSHSHKKELFTWLKENIFRLNVLLIANRKDASDDNLLDSLKMDGVPVDKAFVNSVDARLPRTLLDEVLEKDGIQSCDAIRVWFHLSRSLFGGESISLRYLPILDAALRERTDAEKLQEQLKKLLLNKLPRISTITADEFVKSFLIAIQHLDETSEGVSPIRAMEAIQKQFVRPISLMVQAALSTYDADRGLDFPEFVERVLLGASDVPPSMKMCAWCCMMRSAASESNLSEAMNRLQEMNPPKILFEVMFIDQVGFPHQLQDTATPNERFGLTFSWGGSYESLEDMTDAVRRGHSINWQDVHEKEWRHNEVMSLRELVILLSACRSPKNVLLALQPSNLRTLLLSSVTDDALKLAKFVLENRVHLERASMDGHNSPYRAAVWALILCEPERLSLRNICPKLVPKDAFVDALEWAATNVSAFKQTRAKDPVQRTRDLVSFLILISRRCMRKEEAYRVPRFWGEMFAPLLDANVAPDIMEIVALHETDCQRLWDPKVRALWRIAQGQATLDDLIMSWEESKNAMLSGEAIRTPYATGLLSLTKTRILEDMQMALLVGGTTVDFSRLQILCGNLTESHICKILEPALVSLNRDRKAGLVNLKGLPGPFMEEIMNEVNK